MTQPTFRNSLFAILESFTPHLLAGPEARVQPNKASNRSPGAVSIFGVLGSSADWFSDTSYEDIRRDVRRELEDPQVKSITLVIDSPGGSVSQLPETADLIHAASRKKPVNALVPGVCASAAYWLASQANTIRLTPSGEVGSIGVLDLHVGVSDALKQSGIAVTAVASSPEKTERAPFSVLSDDARAHMQRGVNEWYGQFLSAVHRGRGARVMPGSKFGDGRMLSAKDALREGLIDFVGGVL